jgi:5'-nucleotidase
MNDAFFLGGIEKSKVRAMRPHIFFDDQMGHLHGAAQVGPCVHIPFGIINAPTPPTGHSEP